ncbi:non-ribosomal peptide synthetase [Plantactinospora sp. KBS50]|uniref:non-ribosomal peptide synthetase n=1 Tax=Plantactinospora sp. KBS50 TaxID=2024580 RepID=UPI000BAAC344|nr:non-ribosomal peptide synthetase [Plantactinospora sp. KBS50]ASW55614.1 non-ribosomal peptide synthetase [Plantactinospora sp. KBS50]
MSVRELLRDIDARGLTITAADGDLRLQGPTDRMDADLVARIRAAKPDLVSYLGTPAGFPVTPLQRAYLLGRGDLVELGGGASHVYHEIEGHWDLPRLTAALRAVVTRHSALRTGFTPDGRQVVHEDVPVHIRVRDLRDLPERARDQVLRSYRERASHRVLPLDRPPLVRAEVSVLAADRMVLHVSHDGLVMDGISMFLFFRAWWQAYQGEPAGADEVPFADYVAELARTAASERAQRSRRWWHDRLPDLSPAPELPLAANPATLTRPRFTQRTVRVAAPDWRRIAEHGRRHGVTPNAVLLTAYAQTLAYWGAGQRFTVNTTVANRPPIHPRIFEAIGNFSDTMLVTAVVDPAATFAERCATIQQELRQALENRHVSGTEVLQELGRAGGAARTPYTFNCAIGYVRPGVDGSALHLFGPEVFSVSQTPQVQLNVFAMEQDGGLAIQVDSVDELFPPGLPAAFVAGYQRLLDGLADPTGWARTDPDLRPDQQRRRREEANDTAAAQPERMLWHDILRQAAQRPDAPAVISANGSLSYGDLLSRAQGAAAWLRERGIGRGDLVGLVMRRGPEQVVGILAALLTGAAYLPVDAGLPAQRRSYLLRDGGVRWVLTNAPGAEPDALVLADVPAGEPFEPPADGHVDDLAYVLYTSGTTGQPKGVMVSHRNVANVVADCTARFGVDATDRFFGISAFNFDLSVYDVFGALSVGAALVLPDADRAADPAHWLDLCERHGVTVWNSVPAIAAMLCEQAAADPARLGALRLLMMSGDRIPPELPAALLRLLPDLEVVSLGGPTETTIWNILHPVGVADDGARPVPYGRPNRNNTAFVRGPGGWDRPDWVAGEIWAGGTGVARGYHGDPDRTAQRFVDGLYNTGDLGRYLPDGSIEILGRSDFQIKVNGYRIEAGEVESRLVAVPAVKQAVVVRRGGAHGDRLVAHVVPAGDDRPGLGELRERLAEQLPDYMIPSALVWHGALPLTRNGKVDRARLAEIEPAPAGAAAPAGAPAQPPTGSTTAASGPSTATAAAAGAASPAAAHDGTPDGTVEAALIRLWSGVLRLPTLAPDASLYDLGGDSLSAARILTGVRKEFGITIPLDQMYDVRTVRLMADRLAAEQRKGGRK